VLKRAELDVGFFRHLLAVGARFLKVTHAVVADVVQDVGRPRRSDVIVDVQRAQSRA
jgi:hypothetical protein